MLLVDFTIFVVAERVVDPLGDPGHSRFAGDGDSIRHFRIFNGIEDVVDLFIFKSAVRVDTGSCILTKDSFPSPDLT
jgi:hypothetical protein